MNSRKDKLRWCIASAIKDRFKINDVGLLLNSTFYIENIPGISYHVKCGIKMLKCGNSKKISLTPEKWMKNIDYLNIILNHLNDKKRMYYLSSSYWKTNQESDIWIKWENPNANNTICDDEKIKDLVKQYKKIKNIDTACALLGGCRKWYAARFITGQEYFNKNILTNIKSIFNNCNLSHNNIEGEEHEGGGKIYMKGKNEKLNKWTRENFFKLCDCVVKFLDCFFAMFEIGDKIKSFAREANQNNDENKK